MNYDIFISYSQKDSRTVEKICSALDEAGLSYFIDRKGISGGAEFPSIIANAIVDSKIFLFVASENSYASKFANAEITFAFNKKEKGRIIPYIIDDSELPLNMQFVFSGINWRRFKSCPPVELVGDLRNMLGIAEGHIDDRKGTNAKGNAMLTLRRHQYGKVIMWAVNSLSFAFMVVCNVTGGFPESDNIALWSLLVVTIGLIVGFSNPELLMLSNRKQVWWYFLAEFFLLLSVGYE